NFAIDRDGRGFHVEAADADRWRVERDGVFFFELTDAEGIVGESEERWYVEAVADQPPTVSLDQPVDHLLATAAATVPLRVLVKDDLAVRRVTLRLHRSVAAEGEFETIPLYDAGESPPDSAEGGERGESRVIEHELELSKLSGLTPGAWLELQVAAEDFVPQSAESVARRISIITPDELEDRLAQRPATILGRLAEALRLEQDARTQTRAVAIQLEEAGRLAAVEVDQLQSAELTQRQVAQLLADQPDSVRALIAALLNELENNRVDSPEVQRRMQELSAAIETIASRHLPEIQGGLTTTLKAARSALQTHGDGRWPGSVAESLGPVGARQDEVIAMLEQLLGQLSQWDSYRRFAREVSRLRREQDEVRERTNQLRLDTLAQTRRDLEPDQRAELRRLVEQQSELARRLDRMLGRMETMRDELQTSDPLAAATLADALDTARRAAVSGQMRESSRELEANRIGQATELQEQLDQDLGELIDVLSNRREHELDRIARQLDDAAGELKSLQGRQRDIAGQMEAAGQNADEQERQRELQRLTREQQKLEEETQRLRRRLERLQANRTGESLSRAGQNMQQAGSAAEQGDANAAADSARQAERDLEDANQQLAQQRQQAKQDLLFEQLARLEHAVEGLVARQQSALDESRRLEDLRDGDGMLTRAQNASVQLLAEEQRTLAAEVRGLADELASAEAFSVGLQGAEREMLRAASRLDRGETNETTQRYQQSALARLKQVQEALGDGAAPRDADDNPQQGESQQPGNNAPPADTVRALSELKLIKLMQLEINRRTTELERLRNRTGELDDEQLRELRDLADEQGQLAELLDRLVAETAAAQQSDLSDELEMVPDLPLELD
ncbi:MAG: hypothetical protein KDA59_04330, partial [Planctomycetales bacterium]|nr:hypothetical protein [Planctomycetales bacterium]